MNEAKRNNVSVMDVADGELLKATDCSISTRPVAEGCSSGLCGNGRRFSAHVGRCDVGVASGIVPYKKWK